jgi:hypothetical protein
MVSLQERAIPGEVLSIQCYTLIYQACYSQIQAGKKMTNTMQALT